MPRNKELEIAYQILGGIPARKINLSDIIIERGRTVKGKPFCGTIACGLGWLLMHPRYKRRGFGVKPTTWETLFKTPSEPEWKYLRYPYVAAEMFGIPQDDAHAIFATTAYSWDYDPQDTRKLSDKQLLLARIKNYLNSKE